MKHVVIGILAHVDAGKTTLSEGMLYTAGAIRSLGRVDHRDTFLDTYELERSRGITIFSKQAVMEYGDLSFTLLDTPGHADFSPEMERTLQVLDLAVLVISAAEGVTGQVKTLWNLLSHYQVPTALFVNKMDQPGADKEAILQQLRESLSSGCTDMTEGIESDAVQEEMALCDEQLLESYTDGILAGMNRLGEFVEKRQMFPVLFGSALKMQGVQEVMDLLSDLAKNMQSLEYPDEFGARIFKISRDEKGSRQTFMKITGGRLSVRDLISYLPLTSATQSANGEMDDTGESDDGSDDEISEKIDQIIVYSGSKSKLIQEALPGMIVAVTGLSQTAAGEGLGFEKTSSAEVLQPILTCSVILPEGVDVVTAYRDLRTLQEEEPMLHVFMNDETREINVSVMGRVQIEILKHLISTRFGFEPEFGPGRIVYKETIRNRVEGVGHFEPLRHYAEVHLMLEPGEPGSGVVLEADCPTDILATNWQRLIMTHLAEKTFRGVLTGSEITDIKITLIAGKAHIKHTEGGDFRQATYRAVRQGLMMAESVLLEPVYRFTAQLPSVNIGRLLSDVDKMAGSVNTPDIQGDTAICTGLVPAATLGDYAAELKAYTKGEGTLTLTFDSYRPCHNAEEVIEEIGYMPEFDRRNTSSSVFCSHGSGTIIPWDQVRDYMHVDTGWRPEGEEVMAADTDYDLLNPELQAYRARETRNRVDDRSFADKQRDYYAGEDELKEIFERTYGQIRSNVGIAEYNKKREYTAEKQPKYRAPKPNADVPEYIIVDGYNVLFASPELTELANRDIKAARDQLMDILSNFAGYRKETIILVYDAYKVAGGQERVSLYNENLYVVFTKEAETADQYIERTSHEIGKKHKVTVATSDAVEQVIIFSGGALRMPAAQFWKEIEETSQNITEHIDKNVLGNSKLGNTLKDQIEKATRDSN